MLHFKKTLLLSTVAVSLVACSTNSPQAQNSPTPANSPAVSPASSPAPQNTGAANTTATNTVQDKQFAQKIKVLQPIKSGKVGQIIKVPVTVQNTSNFVWSSAVASPVHLSYNWYDTNGNRVVWNGERTNLTKSLPPQASEKLNATIKFPDRPGKYNLIVTMVQEGVSWFNEAGAESPQFPVTVTSK